MRGFLIGFIITIISVGLLIADAQSKRFGGGKSFGYNRSSNSYSRTTNNTPHASPTANAAAKPAGMSKWLAPLAGLAAGGLLASLFMGHGLGAGILSWLLIAGGIFIVWNLIRNKIHTPHQQRQAAFEAPSSYNNTSSPAPFSASTIQSIPINAQSAEFDQHEFLRHAKSLFIRLQAAYDHKNLTDLHAFTSAEVFAEIRLQLQERNDEKNQTDVVSIDAKLLDLAIEPQSMIASVLFSGMIREEQDSPAQAFQETWHLRKDQAQSNWVVAGIQQG